MEAECWGRERKSRDCTVCHVIMCNDKFYNLRVMTLSTWKPQAITSS